MKKDLRKTKIVGTIGPASENKLEELFAAGLNVTRVNYSHGSWDEQAEKTEEKKTPVKQEVKEPVVEQPKVFKPSPVISPIYGILDKDYKKEEIAPKKVEVKETTLSANTINYDTVRRKAYGTLEDDLEDTLNKMNKLTPNDIQAEVQKIDSDVNKLEERSNKIEDLITKIESSPEMNKNVSVGELEDKVKLENFDDTTELSNDKTMTDSTLEHDLFNLIDSMYDEGKDDK